MGFRSLEKAFTEMKKDGLKNLKTTTKFFKHFKKHDKGTIFFNTFLYLYEYRDMTLPYENGMYGNLLAVALKYHEFDIAKYILLNSDVRIDKISYNFSFKNEKSAEDHISCIKYNVTDSERKKLEELLVIIEEKRKTTYNPDEYKLHRENNSRY